MANEKNTIYVGGLADEVTEKLLNDIFIVFGDISEIQMPTGELAAFLIVFKHTFLIKADSL